MTKCASIIDKRVYMDNKRF